LQKKQLLRRPPLVGAPGRFLVLVLVLLRSFAILVS
jgi:hypothetical protein